MQQKKFMNIQRLKDQFVDGFRPGDMIVVQEKIDGSNAATRYDAETGTMVAFSRKKTLDQYNTLNGFYNYIQTLNVDDYKEFPQYVIFGEWTGARNAIIYNKESTNKWYVFDIYDVEKEQYLPQEYVKEFAEEHDLIYVNTYYVGPFISWEHTMSFMGTSAYGDTQEGIVVKNQTRLNDQSERLPFVVKIVGEKFQEIKKSNHIKKIQDPQKLQERENAILLTENIVTYRRVEKELYKMRDEEIVPQEWNEKDMGMIAKLLPRRIYDDCMKEEPDVVLQIGENFGKFCSSTCMKHARNIVLGTPG